MISCLIVDDDPVSRKILERFVDQTDFLQLVASAGDAFTASKVVREQPVDLVFLDVEMPEMNGMEFLDSMARRPEIVFVSSKQDYAASAFEYEALDYIVKPAAYPRFLKAAQKALSKLGATSASLPQDPGKLFVKSESHWVGIDIQEILLVEALADYVKIHTKEKRFTVYSSMKGIEGRLPESQFMRVHRSYIVNLKKITAIDGNSVSIGENLVPVGVTFQKKLMDRLNLL